MRFKDKKYTILALCLSLLLCCPTIYKAYSEEPPPQKKLDNLIKKAKKTEKAIKKQVSQEKSILTALSELDMSLDNKKRELAVYEYNLAQSQKTKEKIEADIKEGEKEIEKNTKLLAGRLCALYKSGGIGLLKVIFSSNSAGELLQSIKMLRCIAHYDARLLEKLKQDRQKLLKAAKDSGEYQNRIKDYKRKVLSERAELLEKQEKRKALLEAVRKDKARQASILQEIKKQSEELRKLMEMSSWSGSPGNFTSFKGHLIWPVKGRISLPFGFHYDTILERKILNNGIRIKAPLGTHITSVASGKIIYAGWFSGYGKLIIIDHGFGVNTLYAHTSELFVSEGQEVKQGEKIASLGDTDSIRGPELYFEIRFKGKPDDPLAWLGEKR